MKSDKKVKVFGIGAILSLLILTGSLATVIGELQYNTPNEGGGGSEGPGGDDLGYGDNGEDGSGLDPLFVQYQVNSSYTGEVYFTNFSYGKYNKKNWSLPNDKYLCAHDELNPLYFTSTALKENNFMEEHIDIVKYNPYDLAIFPSFVTNGPANNNDYVINYRYPKEYELNFIPIKKDIDYSKIKLSDKYKDVERSYRKYAFDNYMKVPTSTSNILAKFMDEHHIYTNDINAIKKVSNIMLNYKTNIKKDHESSGDIAIDLINGYTKPTTLSYATVSTLIYRLLGYPSRVAGGYKVNLVKDKKTIIDNTYHTCWSEVYINNLGWIPIEVSPNILKMYDDLYINVENDYNVYKIKPFNEHKKYDGEPIEPKQKIQGLDPFLKKGFSYECKVEGKRTELGISYSHITDFSLKDAFGDDVTHLYKFDLDEGILQVYLEELTLETEKIEQVYNGEYLSNNKCNIDEYKLQSNHKIVEKRFIKPFKDVGRHLNEVSIKITDEDDNDVTDYYYIKKNFAYCEIKPRPLLIKTCEASKEYDGTSLTCNHCEAINLVDSDEVYLVYNGRQQDIGTSLNTISKIMIVDKNSKQETINNYRIEYDFGKLTVY